jgi:TPR repeat protein
MSDAMIRALCRLFLAVSFLAFCFAARADGLQDAKNAYGSGDYTAALKEFKALAGDSNAVAQFYVGLMYYNGEGVLQDYKEALSWFQKAADQGLAAAQSYLGVMYFGGQGVPLSYQKGADWYLKAATQGDAAAQFNLGLMYFVGNDDIPRDYKKALMWYEKAAEQKDIGAQNSVGRMYENGLGMPNDFVRGYMWYFIAEQGGSESAKQSRSVLESKMSAEQISQAQAMAQEWLNKHK